MVFTFFACFSLLVTMFLLMLSMGNFSSSIWPYWLPMKRPSWSIRTGLIPGLISLVSVNVIGVLAIPPALAVLLPHGLGLDGIAYFFMPVSILYGLLIYSLTLTPAANVLRSNEFLVLHRVAEREEL
jgi:hypothetical protein